MKKIYFSMALLSFLAGSCTENTKESATSSNDSAKVTSTNNSATAALPLNDSLNAAAAPPEVKKSNDFVVSEIPAKFVTPLIQDTIECTFFRSKKDYTNDARRNISKFIYLGTYEKLYLYIDGKLQEFKNNYDTNKFSNKEYRIKKVEKITHQDDMSNSELEGAYSYDATLTIEITRLSDAHTQTIEVYGGCAGE